MALLRLFISSEGVTLAFVARIPPLATLQGGRHVNPSG